MKKKSLFTALVLTSIVFASSVSSFAFNPQPEPPGDITFKFVNPGIIRGFNPQPEPPGDKNLIIKVIQSSVIK